MVFPCYKELHAIENKYDTLMVPDSDPLMIALHKKLGIKKTQTPRKKQKAVKYTYHEGDEKIVELVKYGYSYRTIEHITGRNRFAIRNIIKHYNLKPGAKFLYKCEGVYIESLSNLEKFGIHAANFGVAKKKAKLLNLDLTKVTYHWGDLESGSRYMLNKDNKHIKIKD